MPHRPRASRASTSRLLNGERVPRRVLRQRRGAAVGGPGRSRPRWPTRRGSCGSGRRTRASRRAGAPCGSAGSFTPDVSGRWRLGLESAGRSVLRIDGALVVDNSDPERGEGFYGAGSEPVEAEHALEAGRSYELAVDLWPRSASSPILGARIGAARPGRGRRVRAGRCRGRGGRRGGGRGRARTGSGSPRATTGPTCRCRVASASWSRRSSPPTPARWSCVNAGSPVEMPWAERAGAVLVTWYPGEEGADALADILVGASEPAGRLPITFPVRVEDGPTGGVARRVPRVRRQGRLRGGHPRRVPALRDGRGRPALRVRARPLLRRHRLRPGGHHARAGHGAAGQRGARRGTEVVQVYLRGARCPRAAPRPRAGGVRESRAWRPASGRSVEVELAAAAYRYWDVDTHGWRSDRGSLRGAGRFLVARHQGERRRHPGRRLGGLRWRPASPARHGHVATVDVDVGPAAGRAAAAPGRSGTSPTPRGSPWRPCASAPSWASSTRPSSPWPCRRCSTPSTPRWGPSPGSACRTCWCWWRPSPRWGASPTCGGASSSTSTAS